MTSESGWRACLAEGRLRPARIDREVAIVRERAEAPRPRAAGWHRATSAPHVDHGEEGANEPDGCTSCSSRIPHAVGGCALAAALDRDPGLPAKRNDLPASVPLFPGAAAPAERPAPTDGAHEIGLSVDEQGRLVQDVDGAAFPCSREMSVALAEKILRRSPIAEPAPASTKGP